MLSRIAGIGLIGWLSGVCSGGTRPSHDWGVFAVAWDEWIWVMLLSRGLSSKGWSWPLHGLVLAAGDDGRGPLRFGPAGPPAAFACLGGGLGSSLLLGLLAALSLACVGSSRVNCWPPWREGASMSQRSQDLASPEQGVAVRILFLMRDLLPPFRPDVAVLFGRELPRLGVFSDLLGQGGAQSGSPWPAGEAWVHGAHRAGIWAEFLRPLRDLAMVCRLRPAHQIVQVRDKIRTAWLARWLCRLRGRRWAYWMSFPMAEGYAVRAQQLQGVAPRWLVQLHRLKARCATWLFYRQVAPNADHVFVQSEAMLAHMVARGVAPARLSAVPMGVDSTLLAAVQPLASHERPVVLDWAAAHWLPGLPGAFA